MMTSDSTNEVVYQENCFTSAGEDWTTKHQEDFSKFSSDVLLLTSDNSENKDSEFSFPMFQSGVKRPHSSGILTSDLLLNLVDREEEASSLLNNVDFTNVVVDEEAQEREETLFNGECLRASPTFVPTFSFTSFPEVSSFGSNSGDKLSKSNFEADWNKMFFDLLSPPTMAKPEPEVAGSSGAQHTKNSLLSPKKEKKLSSAEKSRHNDIQTKVYIEKPTDNDVILGRGSRSNRHKGNVVYRQLVEDNKVRYKDIPKSKKTTISRSLVNKIKKEHHGRFLCLDQVEEKWYVVPDAVARKKVSQALREINTPEFRAAKRRKYAEEDKK